MKKWMPTANELFKTVLFLVICAWVISAYIIICVVVFNGGWDALGLFVILTLLYGSMLWGRGDDDGEVKL